MPINPNIPASTNDYFFPSLRARLESLSSDELLTLHNQLFQFMGSTSGQFLRGVYTDAYKIEYGDARGLGQAAGADRLHGRLDILEELLSSHMLDTVTTVIEERSEEKA